MESAGQSIPRRRTPLRNVRERVRGGLGSTDLKEGWRHETSEDASPDATGVGTSTPSVRSERDGGGDGRVDHISFTATANGTSCTGSLTVGVPHDQGQNGGAVDGGALYDSTQP
jgi:hypothetical protein